MIYIDPRVGSAHLLPLISEMGVPTVLEPLEFGDVAFVGNGPDGPVRVGIEVKGGKGGSDFIQSMQSGRLAGHQVDGMKHYDRRYLIVEGLRPNMNGVVWNPYPRQRATMRPIFMIDIEKYITGLEESGLRVRFTTAPLSTARLIVKQLYAFWQEEYDKHSSINTVYVPPVFSLPGENEKELRFRRVLKALKAGVGDGRSKGVARHFGSILAMVTSDVDAWAGIEGIGKKTAGEVIRVVREEIGGATVSTAKESVSARGPARRVSPGANRAHRGAASTRHHQGARVDPSAGAQRSVRTASASRRVAPRNQSERRNHRGAK